MAITTFDLKLISTQQITPNVKHLTFTRADGQRQEFIPGQFINLYFEKEGKRHSRSYSIATIPGQTEHLEIAISHVAGGLASENLAQLQVGDTILAAGPVGRLVLKAEEQPKHYILVGTGTGIAPYRAMLPSLKQRLEDDPDLRVSILLGVREVSELLYVQDFLAFCSQSDRSQFFACLSQEISASPPEWECGGRVTHVLKELTPNPSHDIVYLCGNPAMIDDAYEILQMAGFDHKNVRREKYVFSNS